jgi:hypothetical protein
MPTPAREFTPRPLTGLPSWPVLLEAGVPKSGKTYAAVEASASDLIGRTFLVTLGETEPDEYGLIPGQRVELIPHDGGYRDVLDALTWAAAQPWPDPDHPNLLIFDGATRLWDLLTDMAQEGTYAALRAKNSRKGANTAPMSDEQKITPDQWNIAASRWGNVMSVLLNDHQGPSIITARLDLVMVMDANGNPTKEKAWKVQAHKSLVFDVDGIIELREQAIPGQPAPATLRGLKSLRFKGEAQDFPDGLPIDQVWRSMGLHEGFGTRDHRTPDTLRSMGLEVANDARRQQDQAAEAPQERPAAAPQQREAARPAAAPGQPPTPTRAAQSLADRWEGAQTEEALARMWLGAELWIMGGTDGSGKTWPPMPWAGQYGNLEAFAHQQGVTWRGRHTRLLEVFQGRRFELANIPPEGDGGTRPQEPQEPRGDDGGPSASSGAPESPEPPQDDAPPPWGPDPRDADVPPYDTSDPWATPQHPGTADEAMGEAFAPPATHEQAVATVRAAFPEAEPVDSTADPETPAQRVAREHADDLAVKRAQREEAAKEAAEDQRGAVGGQPGKTPPPAKGEGYAAFQKAKAEAAEAAARIAAEDHSASAGKVSANTKGRTK